MTMSSRGKKLCDQSGVSRRQALKIGAQGIGLGILGGVSPLPPMFEATSTALAATEGKILVVFEWFGGYDGLSTFVPYGDDALYRHRPNIGIPESNVIKVDDHFGFQRSMLGMHRLWDEGNAAVIHGAGYDQPSFSHFASSSYWHTGAPNSGEPYGWYGRTADALDPTGTPNFLVNISSTQSLAVRARDHVPVVFEDPSGFRRDLFHPQRSYVEQLGNGQPARSDTHKFLLDVNQSAREASALVRQAWENYNTTRNSDLRLLDLDRVVALIENDFPARLYYVRLRNSLFDTHVNQESPHDRQVQYCSDAVWGFFSIYILLFIVLLLGLIATDLDFVTAFSAVGSALNNLGPGLGAVAENYAEISSTAKFLLCLGMVLGRLEIFTILVLFTAMFWRK